MSFATVLDRLAAIENPYPGLRPFDTSDAHLFFGRDRQIAELAALLERNRFVAVVGVSGSGKSSLVRAGLIPALERGQVREARRQWRVVVATPGRAPFTNLAAKLHAQGFDSGGLEKSSHGLIEVAEQLGKDETLLVVVDQFEELFRYRDATRVTAEAAARRAAASAEAAAFVQVLLAASGHHPPIYIVLTMRSDYLGDCAEFRDLPEALNRSQYLVPRLTRQERKEAIECPLGPVAIAPGLVQRMLNDVGDEPEQLPILQHALMRTWTRWRNTDPDQTRGIEPKDYEAIGGFQNALNDHAEGLLKTLNEPIVATLFKRLTANGRGNRERRDPARLEELWALCDAKTDEERRTVTDVIDALRRTEATFLTPRLGPLKADSDIDITHESLIRLWRNLRDQWMPEEQKAARTFLELAARAATWRRGGPTLAGLDLSDALAWRDGRNKSPAWAEHYADAATLSETLAFVESSAAEERRRLRRLRRTHWLMAGGAVLSLLIAIAFLALFARSNIARQAADAAKNAMIAAQLQGLVRQLTAHAYGLQAEGQAESALLLAAEALQRQHTPEDDRVLRQLVAVVPRPVASVAHGKTVRFIAFGPGRSIVIRTIDERTVSATSASDGRELWRSGNVSNGTIAVSGDGTRVVEASADGSVVARDAKSGRELWRSVTPVYAAELSFSPNGRVIACAGFSDFAVLASDTGKQLFRGTMTAAFGASRRVAFTADGALIAFASAPAPIIVDAATGAELPRLPPGPPLTDLQFSPKSAALLATGDDGGSVRMFNARTGRQTWERKLGRVRTLTFSADGLSLATGGYDSVARVLDARSGAETTRIALSDGARSLTFSPDGRWVATGTDDGSARVFESRTGKELWRVSHAGSVVALAFSPDSRLLSTGSDDGVVRTVALTRADEVSRFFVKKEDQKAVGLSPDARRLAMIVRTGLQLREIPAGRIVASVPFKEDEPAEFSVSPDGRWVAYGDGKQIHVMSAQDGKLAPRINSTQNSPQQITFSPDGDRIAVAAADAVVLYETVSGMPKLTLKAANARVASFSADGRRIAVQPGNQGASEAGHQTSYSVPVFEVAGGREVGRIPTSGNVEAIGLSADGKLIAVSMDKTLRVFQVATAAQVSVAAYKGGHSLLSFSPDGAQIASSAADAVHVFDVASGTEISRISEPARDMGGLFHEGGYVMTVVAFEAPDGVDVVASRHPTGRDDLLKEACSRLPRDLTADEWRLYAGTGIDYSPACKAYR